MSDLDVRKFERVCATEGGGEAHLRRLSALLRRGEQGPIIWAIGDGGNSWQRHAFYPTNANGEWTRRALCGTNTKLRKGAFNFNRGVCVTLTNLVNQGQNFKEKWH